MIDDKQSQSIQVCIRVRPTLITNNSNAANSNANAASDGQTQTAWIWDKDSIKADEEIQGREINYGFDTIFGPENTNQEIFSSVAKDIVSSTMAGY